MRTFDGARPAQGGLRLSLLGSPCLLPEGRGAVELGRLDAAMLALLVLEGGVERARVAALLWPDASPRRAGISLRQRIFRLRRSAGMELVSSQRRLALDPQVGHDLHALLAGAGDGFDGAEPPRGELLGDFDYTGSGELSDWVAVARGRWHSVRREALAVAAAQNESAGRLAAALNTAERLLELIPHSEHAHRRVMRLHYLRGDRAAALAAYERCRQWLHQLIGQPPGGETRTMAEAMERGGDLLPAPSVAEAPPSPPPLAVLRPPRLVGREASWQQIDDAAARHRPLLLGGEAGIGKTRLLVDWLQAHGPGLVVDARPGDRRIPYALAARLLQQLAGHQGLPGPAEGSDPLAILRPKAQLRRDEPMQVVRLQAVVGREVLRAAAGGLRVLALDDLQFADDASLELLLPLSLQPGGLQWLLAAREAERPLPLVQWLAEAVPGGHAVELPLSPWPTPAVHELLTTLDLPGLGPAAWAEALRRHTGGHPMFLLETLRTLLSVEGRVPAQPGVLPWPATLGPLIERRLQTLDADARRLAHLAALADVDFSVALAAQVLQAHPLDLAEPWQALQRAGVFGAHGFAHDLMREACLRSVPLAIAQALHGPIAGVIDAAGAPAARVADHHRRAGQWPAAAQAWRRAAAAALLAGRRREEAELLQAAMDDYRCAAADPRSTAADSERYQAEAFDAECERIGALVQCTGADELRIALAALQARPASAAQQARRALAAAEAQIVFGEFETVVAAMPAAILQLTDDAGAAVLGTRRLAVALLNLGRASEAAQALDGCLPRLDQRMSDRERYEFLGELGTVLERCNRRREGHAHLQQGIALALQAQDQGTAATMVVNLGINRVYWGDAEAAIAATEQGLALRRRHDGITGLASGMDMTLGAMCRDAGRYGEAIERLERSHAAFAAEGNRLWTANTAAHLGLLWLQLGQRARAARVLQVERAQLPAFIVARLMAARALLDQAQGRPGRPGLEDALAQLATADRVDVRLGIQLERLPLLDPEPALVQAQAVADEAERCELMGHAYGARVLLVDALRRAGRADEAARRAEPLAADPRPLAPSGFYRPALWLVLVQALCAGGRTDLAAPVIERANGDLQRALSGLDGAFHDGFRFRQPVNQALAAVTRR